MSFFPYLFFSGTCLLGWLCGHAWRKIDPALADRVCCCSSVHQHDPHHAMAGDRGAF